MSHSHALGTALERKPFYGVLHLQVLLAISIGVLIGAVFPEVGASLKPLGDAFIKLVKMIVARLICCTIVTAIGGACDGELQRRRRRDGIGLCDTRRHL